MSRLEKLKEIAKDLNETMALDPAIDTDVESAKVLKNAIKREMETGGEDGGCQLFPKDRETLQDETWEYLTETLGIEPREQEAAAPPSEKPKKSEKIQEKKEEKKVATKKKAAAKKKAAKKAAAKKKATPAKKNEGPSNKEKAYKLWKNGKGIKDPEKIQAKVPDVKVNTIKGWLNAWANGKNLPACAKK
jgi:hypothetical protein